MACELSLKTLSGLSTRGNGLFKRIELPKVVSFMKMVDAGHEFTPLGMEPHALSARSVQRGLSHVRQVFRLRGSA
jgi:hypothetical protein